MFYTAVLAGGLGIRMGNTEVPKQFLPLGSKPVIVHTIEKFLLFEEINEILVLVPETWVNYSMDIINKNISIEKSSKITVLTGGSTRNETIMKAVEYISENYGIEDDDFIITHDAVRPFVSYRIIKENIEYVEEFGATDTVIPAVDTIVISKDANVISEIPIRDHMFIGQTPQSFKIELLIKAYSRLTEEQKSILSDAAKIFVLNDLPVKIVSGEEYNIKITTQYDLLLANAILERAIKND